MYIFFCRPVDDSPAEEIDRYKNEMLHVWYGIEEIDLKNEGKHIRHLCKQCIPVCRGYR